MKVVINNQFGGFSFSPAVYERMGWTWDNYGHGPACGLRSSKKEQDALRSNARLVTAVEELGNESWGRHAHLTIVEIPDGTDYVIFDFDGREMIVEQGHYWGYP